MARSLNDLGRRERQIMDAIHRLGEATVSDVRAALADPPSYSSVRTMMRLLESKRYLTHRQDGIRYVYRSTQSLAKTRTSALKHVLNTFFGGSTSDAVAALIELAPGELTDDEVEQLQEIIRDAKERESKP
jgi:BlaI family transcriptional regulator, penicillinase repressor